MSASKFKQITARHSVRSELFQWHPHRPRWSSSIWQANETVPNAQCNDVSVNCWTRVRGQQHGRFQHIYIRVSNSTKPLHCPLSRNNTSLSNSHHHHLSLILTGLLSPACPSQTFPKCMHADRVCFPNTAVSQHSPAQRPL